MSSPPPKPPSKSTPSRLAVGTYASASLSRALTTPSSLASSIPQLQSTNGLGTVLRQMGYKDIPEGGEDVVKLGYHASMDSGFNRKVNTKVRTGLKKKLDSTIPNVSSGARLKLLQSVYPYRFQTPTFLSIYTSLIHTLLSTPSSTPSNTPIVCGKVPIKILRMVKDGDTLGERIWGYVKAVRGKGVEDKDLIKGDGGDQMLLGVMFNSYLEDIKSNEEKVVGANVWKAFVRTELVHGYEITNTWDGGVRGNKGTEAVKEYVKSVLKLKEGASTGVTEVYDKLRVVYSSVGEEVEYTIDVGMVREAMKDVVEDMIRGDKQSTFLNPVENIVKGYNKIIRYPMCYADIRKNLRNGRYDNVNMNGSMQQWFPEFRRDFMLVYSNCREFNKKGGQVWVDFANEQQGVFEGRMRAMCDRMKKFVEGERSKLSGGTVDTGKADGVGRWGNVLMWAKEATKMIRVKLEAKGKEEILESVTKLTVPKVTPTFKVLSFLYDGRINTPGKYDLGTEVWMSDLIAYITAAVAWARTMARGLKGGDLQEVDMSEVAKPSIDVLGEILPGGMAGMLCFGISCILRDMGDFATSKEGAMVYREVAEDIEKYGGFEYRDLGGEGKVGVMCMQNVGKLEGVREAMEEWIWREDDREDRLRVLAFYAGKGNEWMVKTELYNHVMKLVEPGMKEREEACVRKISKRFADRSRKNVFMKAGLATAVKQGNNK